MKNVYLDHASTTYMTEEVISLVSEIMRMNYGNPSSIHALGRQARAIVEKSRKTVAKILNASVGEIYFTSSATEANNTIIKRSIVDLDVKTFITSPTEHHCILHSLDKVKKEHDVNVVYLSVNENGEISLEELSAMIERYKSLGKIMVTLMHGNNEIGTIHPVDEVSKICVAAGVYFHCDAVQSLGKINIDVQATEYSFLSGSAHKFHGPKGSGFFYMNNENIIQPYIDGGAQERNMRAGTENVYGIAGMSKALMAYVDSREEHCRTITEIRDYFETSLLTTFPDVKINASFATKRLPHISSVSFPTSDKADMIMFNLDINGICASSGSACSAGIEEDSHVLKAIGHPSERKTIRFSFSPRSTIEEVDYVVEVLKKII